MTDDSLVAQASSSTSGLSINLQVTTKIKTVRAGEADVCRHPLPILNISEHQTRSRLTSKSSQKLVGALLGSRENRQISISNSFELVVLTEPDLTEEGQESSWPIDREFFDTRKAQFEEVFPSLTVVGWYSVGSEPTADDVHLQKRMTGLIESPVFLLFGTDEASGLPLKVYEATVEGEEGNVKFAELGYGIETGEAERIAVDGVSRGTSDESAVVSNLTTQRNAIRMLHERIVVLLQYVTAVINKQATPDHTILRQISSIVAGLPTMNTPQFEQELATEYSDVQLTEYLTTLTKQLSTLNDYADKHAAVVVDTPQHEHGADGGAIGSGGRGRSFRGAFGGSAGGPSRRQR